MASPTIHSSSSHYTSIFGALAFPQTALVFQEQRWQWSQFAPSLQPFFFMEYLHAMLHNSGWPTEPKLTKGWEDSPTGAGGGPGGTPRSRITVVWNQNPNKILVFEKTKNTFVCINSFVQACSVELRWTFFYQEQY